MESKNQQINNAVPTVVIIGRTNTGKTTLFNRLTGQRAPLVSAVPGTTRDWREGRVSWNGIELRLIDTGGIDQPEERVKKKGGDTSIESGVRRQAWTQLMKADLALLLVDADFGVTPGDRLWASHLRKRNIPTIIVVNKIDAPKNRERAQEFWSLGLGDPFPISATTGMGVGDLLDAVVARLSSRTDVPLEMKKRSGWWGDALRTERGTPGRKGAMGLIAGEAPGGREGGGPPVLNEVKNGGSGRERGRTPTGPAATFEQEVKPIRVAIIGKPNVGKSSLLNSILGEDRVIVSPIPGTTREPIDTELTVDDQPYVLIDTAGIRRKWKTAEKLESAGADRTRRVLQRTDVALLVIEAQTPLTSQDMRLADELVEARVGVVIIANKWDLFKEDDLRMMGFEAREEKELSAQFADYLRHQLPHLAWAPILYISSKTGRNTNDVLPVVVSVYRERIKRITPEELERWMKTMTYRPDKSGKAKKPHIYGVVQTEIEPPRFQLVTEVTKVPTRRAGIQKGTVRSSYVRFLENRLRHSFGFEGTPIIVEVKTIKRR